MALSERQALCIGINAYKPDYLRLRPCINDATDLSNSLRSIGFRVKCANDLDLTSMKSATHRFVDSIQPGAIVLFYFSGHGVQYNGDNYLIPTNGIGICSDNIKSTAIDAQKLINDMHKKRPRLVICILDCCRTDPPSKPIDGRPLYDVALAGTKPGLAPMQAPSSTIIVYACGANDTASAQSKNGRNSLYTFHLLHYIQTPNADIENVLRYVAAAVQKDSNNQQIPFRYSSCNEAVCLGINQALNVPALNQHAQMMPAFQPLYKQHEKPNFQHRLNGQFGVPINRHLQNRNKPPNAIAVPRGSGFPFLIDVRHRRP